MWKLQYYITINKLNIETRRNRVGTGKRRTIVSLESCPDCNEFGNTREKECAENCKSESVPWIQLKNANLLLHSWKINGLVANFIKIVLTILNGRDFETCYWLIVFGLCKKVL